ncbi:unnamed protein product [Lampetra planeri]
MDRAALGSLALERLLSLVQELSVALSITEEDDLTSLKVALCIQAHFSLRQWPTMAACTGEAADPEGPTPKEMEQACASFTWSPRERAGVARERLSAGLETRDQLLQMWPVGPHHQGMPKQHWIIRLAFYGFCPAGICFPSITWFWQLPLDEESRPKTAF